MPNKYQQINTFSLPINFRGRGVVTVQLWWLIQSTLFGLSPQFMYKWRNFLLRLFGAKIGRGVVIRPSVKVTYPWKLSIGDYSWIGDDVTLYTLGEIDIGNHTVVSQKSYLCTASHNYDKFNFPIWAKKITIEDECWLATDVYIAPGITIGRGTVVGAKSSVFKDLPSGMVCIGSPAKPVKPRAMSE
jgi:putative colanic acid biosynthesis acetyltransferase WcaF